MSASKQKKLSRMEVRLKTPKEKREPLGKKYKNKNEFWTDLQKHYSLAKSSSSRIFNEHVANVSGILINKDKLSLVINATEFNNLHDSILKEVESYNTKIETIYSKHKEFKGSAIETDETVQAMALINDYLMYAEDFKDNLVPLATKFNSIIKQVNLTYAEQQKTN
jgi:hypothetical protein